MQTKSGTDKPFALSDSSAESPACLQYKYVCARARVRARACAHSYTCVYVEVCRESAGLIERCKASGALL